MGTHATTRISSDDDFLEFHTRWDGFEEEIKKDLKNLDSLWDAAISLFEEKLQKNKVKSIYLIDWLEKLKIFVNDYKLNNNLESAAVLFCSKCFSHHHVFLITIFYHMQQTKIL